MPSDATADIGLVMPSLFRKTYPALARRRKDDPCSLDQEARGLSEGLVHVEGQLGRL